MTGAGSAGGADTFSSILAKHNLISVLISFDALHTSSIRLLKSERTLFNEDSWSSNCSCSRCRARLSSWIVEMRSVMSSCCFSSVLVISDKSGLEGVPMFPSAASMLSLLSPSSVALRCGGKNKVFRAVERSFASERTESSSPKSSCVFKSVGLGALKTTVGERSSAIFDWLFDRSDFFAAFIFS